MKKITAVLLVLFLVLGLATPAWAETPVEVAGAGQQRVAVGADLTSAQKAQIYSDFGIPQGSLDEITVTNAEERKYLEGLVSDSVIGTKAYSSIFITTQKPGTGLDISLTNITWVSKDIYRNALITAGITDARVIISAPFGVSGTAALTGIYKAYEDITGKPIPEEAKKAAAEELVVSSELSDELGSENVAALINELKLKIDDLKKMADEQARQEIKKIAVSLDITLTAEQVEKFLNLVRSLEKVDLSAFKGALESISKNLGSLADTAEKATGFWNSVKGFFSGIVTAVGDFFTNLFSGE